MYHPIENDNYNEWIEIYNPKLIPINVSDWTLFDGQQEDTLEGNFDQGTGTTIIPPHGYAIITDHGTEIYDNFNVSESAIKLYVDDSAICGYGLNNEKEKLLLNDTSGTVIDAMEWGYDYPDVPGLPADDVNEGNSVARYHNTDTNNSIMDFYYGITPTPGRKNIVDFNIDLYPLYVSKVQYYEEYSKPFAIKTSIGNITAYENYQVKSYVVGDVSSIWPSTQTWNGASWKYSNNYTSSMTTDSYGNWSGWHHLRFKKDYVEYKGNIENNSESYLIIKIKKDDISYRIIKKIFLLDMDKSTLNGTMGGYAVGRAEKDQEFLENKTIIVENRTGIITGIYFTEDNGIEDDLASKSGYYKISSPVDSGYKLNFYENDSELLHVIPNINIEQGEYGINIKCMETYYQIKRNELLDIPLIVKNIGDFSDVIDVKINSITKGWVGTLERDKIYLNPGEMSYVNLHIIPCQKDGCKSADITISSTSEKDVGESDEINIQIDILAPDLTITNLTCYNSFNQKINKFGEGELVRIKANIKNLGNENATDFDVTFYYDSIDKNHFVGSKHYDSISKYHKYPSVEWDTTNVVDGNHTIFVIVDEVNNIEEFNESNNEFSMQVEIYNTGPYEASKNILITEVYYHTHTRVKNEFIVIYNPTNNAFDISGWYITNTPWKNTDEQTKIIFPDRTIILPKTSFHITQNASAFFRETGELPDFEYAVNSRNDVMQLDTYKTLTLSNTGALVAIKDGYNHTVDLISYGESDHNSTGWIGPPIKKSGSGVILKRNFYQDEPIDTNSSSDWNHPRIYGIGQSDFPYVNLPVIGEIITFVSPDCSFKTIVGELKKAEKSIYFNIYEFTNPFLCDELVSALKRNVSVYIFLEGAPVGGIDDREKFILNRIANNGGRIRFIVNDPDNDVYDRYRFDHGKYLVIDNYTVIVESCNWAKTGVPIDPTFGNREWGIVVKNETVANYFLNVFLDDWNPQRCDSYSFDNMDFSISPDFYMDETVYRGSYEPQFESKTFTGNFTAVPVFSPGTSERAICTLIESANNSIYIEQLYIYKDWNEKISPFVERLVNKSKQGVDVKIILNYNPYYKATNEKCNQTKQYFEENDIEVKFVYTNWSYFSNVHNKGMIVDNTSVLISSINWNENSVTKNREAGIIIENQEIATYYAEVFFYDWELDPPKSMAPVFSLADLKNPSLIVLIYGLIFALVAQDWRKRKWT